MPAVVVHTPNLSSWEAKAGGVVNVKPSWVFQVSERTLTGVASSVSPYGDW